MVVFFGSVRPRSPKASASHASATKVTKEEGKQPGSLLAEPSGDTTYLIIERDLRIVREMRQPLMNLWIEEGPEGSHPAAVFRKLL
jgi:hypothetical protein